MFRYELDSRRKIMVLVVHGTQDGWEAKLMRLDWPRQLARAGSDWNLIVDLSEYITPNGQAQREQRKLSVLFASASFSKRMLVRGQNPAADHPFEQGVSFEVHSDYLSAWNASGGERRTVRIPAPADGSRYPASTPPPRTG